MHQVKMVAIDINVFLKYMQLNCISKIYFHQLFYSSSFLKMEEDITKSNFEYGYQQRQSHKIRSLV